MIIVHTGRWQNSDQGYQLRGTTRHRYCQVYGVWTLKRVDLDERL